MANVCPKCGKGELILREVSAKVSVAGLFGALLAVIGLVVAFFNGIFGVIIIILGILIGYFGRGKHVETICPMCGHKNKL